MVEDEVAHRIGGAGELLGDDMAVRRDVIMPGRLPRRHRPLGHRAGGGIVEIGGGGDGAAHRQRLGEALVLIVIGEGGAGGAGRDGGHHVEAGPARAAPAASDQ